MKRFTLIELLVVVAIIGILTTFLLPSLSDARGKARQAVCLNNIRTVNIGLEMFADDNDSYIAKNYSMDRWNAMDWPMGIDVYIGGSGTPSSNKWNFKEVASPALYGCPTTSIDEGMNKQVFDADYGIPVRPGQISSYVGYKKSAIEKASESVILGDGYNKNDTTRGRSTFQQQHAYSGITGQSTGQYKHVRKFANYAFFDGHAIGIRWTPEGDFRSKYTYDLYNLPNLGFTANDITP